MVSPLHALGDPELGHIFIEFSDVLRGMFSVLLRNKETCGTKKMKSFPIRRFASRGILNDANTSL